MKSLWSARKLTLLLIPEGSDRVRKVHLRPSFLLPVAMVLAVMTLLSGYVMVDYVRLRSAQSELTRLRLLTSTQSDDVKRLATDLEDLHRQMVLLGQTDAKIRVLARLDPPKADGMTGMGGSYSEESSSDLTDLQYQIDHLRAQIDLQRTSHEEIYGILNDQHSLIASTPTGLPTKGWMTSIFGMRNDPFTGMRKFHHGLDIAARTGTAVYATADGVVSRVENLPGYGKSMTIDHGYGYKTRFAHTSRILVKVGDRVKRHQKVAEVGNTGRSTGSHLHYEILVDGIPVNPKKFL